MTRARTSAAGALAMRAGLARERERAWQHVAAPGTWWRGAERLAIAAEARQARSCRLCARRARALSPYGVEGEHQRATDLPGPLLEVVHRVRTDAGRLTRSWYESVTAAGIDDVRYVEAVGVVAIVTALDTFDEALGLAPRALPEPGPGQPARRRPPGARADLAWVPTVAPDRLAPGDPDLYSVHGDKNIHRALSLVPAQALAFFDLDVELYLADGEIRDFATEHRALSHAQIELMAGRVSALNGCYY
jgi:hypothetical protein